MSATNRQKTVHQGPNVGVGHVRQYSASIAAFSIGLLVFHNTVDGQAFQDSNGQLQGSAPSSLVGQNQTPLATPVTTIVLEEESSARMARSFTGTLRPTRSSDLGFKRVGRIESFHVQRGELVETGQVIAELDTAGLNAEMAILAAQRAAAIAKFNELVAGPRRQSLAAAKAQVAELAAIRDQLKSTFARRTKLSNSDAISVQDIDDARHQVAAAEAKLAAQSELLAELEEGTRSEQIEAQRAEVTRLDATIQSVRVQFDESKLTAPYAGVIARRMVDEGTIVQPGMPLVRILELSPLEAWIGLPPDALGDLSLGDRYSLTIQGVVRQAVLKTVLPEVDQATRTQTAIFILGELKLETHGISPALSSEAVGQIAHLNLTQRVEQAGFWLPLSALTRSNKGLWSVYVVLEREHAGTRELTVERSDVEVIQIDSSKVLVRGTIKSGDRVVVGGIQKLTVGQRISLATESSDLPPTHQTNK